MDQDTTVCTPRQGTERSSANGREADSRGSWSEYGRTVCFDNAIDLGHVRELSVGITMKEPEMKERSSIPVCTSTSTDQSRTTSRGTSSR